MPLSLPAVALLFFMQSAATAATPIDIVKRFYDAYQRLDIDGMTAVMAPDMVFDDPTFRLHANSRAEWRTQAEPNRLVITRISAEIHSTVQSGDTVAVELTLSGGIKTKGGVRDFKVRCASFFSVRNSLITRWTDYCDYRTFTEQTTPTR
jgi:ketosteroid isomerase-like protein